MVTENDIARHLSEYRRHIDAAISALDQLIVEIRMAQNTLKEIKTPAVEEMVTEKFDPTDEILF
jgi:prefoldin subunit 5